MQGRLKFAVDDVDAPENWPRTLVLWRANLLGSSSKGNEYFLKHLLGTHSNLMAEEGAEDIRPTEVAWRDDIPEGKLDLLVSADFRMTSTTMLSDVVLPGRHLVREARPLHHRHAPVRARVQPGDRPAVGGQERLRDLPPDRPEALGPGPHAPRRPARPGRASPCSTTPRARPRSRAGSSVTGGAATSPPSPARPCRRLQIVERDYTAIADKLAAIGPLADSLGFTVKNVTYRVEEEVERLRHAQRRDARRRGRRPAGDRHRHQARRGDPRASPARPTASWRCRASAPSRSASASRSPTSPKGSEEKRITFADTQAATGPGDHLAGVVRLGDRRPPLRAVHRQRRAAQAVAHPDRADALLPRPRLDARPRRVAADLPAAAGPAPAPRRAHPRRGRAASRSPCAT